MRISEMTVQQKRVAIAEACGRCQHVEKEYWCIEDGNDFDSGYTCKKCGKDPYEKHEAIPDYLNSLDAMREAVKFKINTEELAEKFCDALRDAANVNGLFTALSLGYWSRGLLLVNATAAQRADAFLLAIGGFEV